MNALDVSRWQFGITTVYHFIFVPLTIGLSVLVAVMQTVWLARKDPAWLRVTKFFGALFLINFAVGVVTGIVQEFQFGMNWPAYSRFAGDVFGAPLAMEALLDEPAGHPDAASADRLAVTLAADLADRTVIQAAHGRPPAASDGLVLRLENGRLRQSVTGLRALVPAPAIAAALTVAP